MTAPSPEPPGDLLRRAASLVREFGDRASEGPWADDSHIGNDGMVVLGEGRRIAHVPGGGRQPVWDAAWIALASPAIAVPLAAWLDQCADYCEAGQYAPTALTHDRPRAMARALLGSPVPVPDGEGT